MPLYEYCCPNCGLREDRIEPFGAPTEHPCPRCSQLAKREISSPNLAFNGGGWYSEGYVKKT